MEILTGSCKLFNGCDIGCSRFRKDEYDAHLCGYCRHDISAHEILGVIQDGKVISLGAVPAVAVVPVPLPMKETPEEERKKIFKTKPRSSVGAKRKITADEDEPRKWSTGRSNPTAAGSTKTMFIVQKLIAMKRDDPIPLSNFDHTELENDYFVDYPLTTAEHLTSILKMTSTMGEYFAKKWYLYTRLTNRSLKPTQYWSQNWPSEKVMASLCQEKHLYVIPHCFDDELINFISAADIEENNYVEILPSTSSSSSSSN